MNLRAAHHVAMLALVINSAMCAIGPTAAAAASIKGTVLLTGTPPPAKKLPVTIDQYVCGKEKDAEDLVVSPQKRIQNVVVWLQNPPQAAKWDPPPPVPVVVDQKGCVFTPRVVLVPAGGTVDFLNSDRLLHNLHAAPKTNPGFSRAQPKGRTIPVTFPAPEIISVNCDLHSWMRGWVVVMEHPFYALTSADGEFVLNNVPPGKFVLQVWHESLGRTSKELMVGNQDFIGVTIEMSAR